MLLTKVKVQNYRLLIDAELDVHNDTTLIVGRNNTAKTSSMDCISTVLKGKVFSYDDYPLGKRNELHECIAQFMSKEISYEELCNKIPIIAIEFVVDYSSEALEDNLGALSPFIIDVDVDIVSALIRVEYRLKIEEKTLWNLLEKSFYKEEKYTPDLNEAREIVIDNFNKIFELTIYAVNPNNIEDKQIKTLKELSELFPFYAIPAERTLGEDGTQNNNTLGKLISSFFEVNEEDLDPTVSAEIMNLRRIIEDANKKVQKNSDEILSSVVHSAIGFGYPNGEELKLGVTTQLNIDDQIKNQTRLSYSSGTSTESLPSTHNGLGYKNLIKMEFMLAAFARDVATYGKACIPILFIEEPESHMHPQMQHAFADYLETFLSKISNVHIQTFLTSHSPHIANTMDFSKIRYAQKTTAGVIYKNLHSFAKSNESNMEFIKKYLTLSRCDLFFADKIIFVEGASERLLLPDMIEKCDNEGLFDPLTYKLPAQYYALIEIGGAYAYKFIPFANFLGLPCLILTDIDSMQDGRTKEVVSKAKTTSNATIKWWMRRVKSLPENDKTQIKLSEIIALTSDQKTYGKCHIEFQIQENGLCGRSLEEAIKNVNRLHYGLKDPVTETNLEFSEKSKTDFALNLIYNNPNYVIPQYIKEGLKWLNKQKVLE